MRARACACAQPCRAMLPQVDKRVAKLVWDLLRPESLPSDWTSEYDAAAGAWCAAERNGR